MSDPVLSDYEQKLFDWIAEEPRKAAGCDSNDLNRLLELGLVDIQEGYVALTEAGYALAIKRLKPTR